MNETQRAYRGRINKALVYIDENITEALDLNSVSEVANYSPFHFHRVFKGVIGETLNEYINRRRVEKAALTLLHKEDVNLTELTHQYGFTSSSSFSRSFKMFYGVSPTEFVKGSHGRFSKIRQENSKNGQTQDLFEKYICNIEEHLKWITMNAKISIETNPQLNFSGLTHIGIDGMETTFDRVIKWARSKGIFEADGTHIARVFHDSFKVTAPDKVRMTISIVSENNLPEDSEIQTFESPEGRCIVGKYIISPLEFEQAWSSLFVWMSEEGYQKRDTEPYEIYYNDFRTHPEGKCEVDLCIPIV